LGGSLAIAFSRLAKTDGFSARTVGRLTVFLGSLTIKVGWTVAGGVLRLDAAAADGACSLLAMWQAFTSAEAHGTPAFLFLEGLAMPLFEVETESHIIITWAADDDAAASVVSPRDTWVISKGALGITGSLDPCGTARDCLDKAQGDKLHAIRLYMSQTGSDLERSRKVIESNMVMGW
jgi:hypothetical protein